MDDFILPDTWCIKITEDTRKIINNWKIKQPVLNDDLFENLQYTYVNHDGGGTDQPYRKQELSIEEFIQYVLKQEIEVKQASIKEDTSYLINFLKQNNIT